MDDRRTVLREKLARLLKEAAEVEVELSREEGAIVGIPHVKFCKTHFGLTKMGENG